MDTYIYAADIFCRECGESIRQQIIEEGRAPADPDDERTYDSDEFPKGPYSGGGGESDCPQHCGNGEDCLNAITLEDGRKVGAWLENDLTSDGVAYVQEAIAEGGEVAELWAEWYRDSLPAPPDPVLWLRVGDADEYHEFDGIDEAAEHLAECGVSHLTRHGDLGADALGYQGNNYISIFWGDAEARPRNLPDAMVTDEEMTALNELLARLEKEHA